MDAFDRQRVIQEQEPAQTGSERRGFIRALLVWLPLVACAGCLVASYLLMPALPTEGIPVTGRDPLIPPTPTPGAPGAAPELQAPAPVFPGFSYRDEAMLRLEACNASFHHFFLMEQVAVHQPEIAEQEDWRTEAAAAMEAFRADCEPLGSMPAAPSAYSEVDTWLKLAAGEVGPAVDGFTVLLEEDDSSRMISVVDHMLKFIEYTQNAEHLIDRLEMRKQI